MGDRHRRGRRAAVDYTPWRGDARGRLARRQDHRVLSRLRGADRSLYHARIGRPAGAPDFRRRRRVRCGLDSRRQSALHHAALFDAARHAARHHRCAKSHRAGASQPGVPGGLRCGRQDALLHAPAISGQPGQALQGRNRSKYLEVFTRRGGGRAHRRLHGHQQGRHVLEPALILPERS